jgi:hypothetical protein
MFIFINLIVFSFSKIAYQIYKETFKIDDSSNSVVRIVMGCYVNVIC